MFLFSFSWWNTAFAWIERKSKWCASRHLLVQSQQLKHKNYITFVPSWQWLRHNDENESYVMSLLLTLSRFRTLLLCFHCWLWASKYRLVKLAVNQFKSNFFIYMNHCIELQCKWAFLFLYARKSGFIQTWNIQNRFICAALCDLVPFVQFKKCEKHP